MLILVMVADLSTILQDRIFRPIISFYALKEKMSWHWMVDFSNCYFINLRVSKSGKKLNFLTLQILEKFQIIFIQFSSPLHTYIHTGIYI